jgi:hypothetical protein
METNEPRSKATRRLYGLAATLVETGWWISRCVGFVVFPCIILTALGDFLQAPIGFKEPPLHHGVIVYLAQMLIWPTIIAWVVMSWFKESVDEWRSKSAE